MDFNIPRNVELFLQKVSNRYQVVQLRFIKAFLKQEDGSIQKWFDDVGVSPLVVFYLWRDLQTTNITWPTCAVCGKLISEEYIVKNKKVKRCCSRSCYALDPQRLEKVKQTSLEKYGVENPFLSVDVDEKRKDSLIKKYGSLSPTADSNVREKIKTTNMERYGGSYPFSSELIQIKAKQTIIDRYGVDNVAKRDDIVELRAQSARFNNFEHYKDMVKKLHNIELLTSRDHFVTDHQIEFRCCVCNHLWKSERKVAQRVICPICSANRFTSNGEYSLFEYIQSVYCGPIDRHNRTILDGHQELDIFLPEKRIAFEYNGNWWHNELYCDAGYHNKKTEQCKANGIRLIHVFEDQWLNKQFQIQSIIKSSLGLYDRVIYARQCNVVALSSSEFRKFIEINHLGEPINASVRIGLEYEGQVVAVAGFGRSRYKKGEIELYRFCNKAGVRVVGGLSKLMHHSGFDAVVSYVDLSHFTGDGYLSSGFELIGRTKPNYRYTNGKMLIDRLTCQKHRLPSLLGDEYDPALTEGENMAKIGFYKIYDCGNLKMLWSANKH